MTLDRLAEAEYYDGHYSGFEYANLLQLERAVHVLAALLTTGLDRPRIMDLGCGAGWLAGILSAFGPTSAIDLSTEALATAKTRFPAVDFHAGDIFEWRGPSGTFDVVVSQEVLEHVEDQPRYLNIAHDLLRSGGYLILTTPNADTMMAMSEAERNSWTSQPIEKWLTRSQLAALLSQQFSVLRMTTIVGGLGTKGSYRVFNSARLRAAMTRVRLNPLLDFVHSALGYGLHIVVLAQKRR